ncbi:MAG: hypothetical protein IJ763_02125 [Lachnospiraceae bacterium]|nr:hypothetical protein [Lachnospiraceae bacterium]
MSALATEIVSYVFKFIVMIICAVCGILVGKVLRKRKDEKTASESSNE